MMYSTRSEESQINEKERCKILHQPNTRENQIKQQEWLKKTIRELIEQELNLEGTCGYGEEGELGEEPHTSTSIKNQKRILFRIRKQRDMIKN